MRDIASRILPVIVRPQCRAQRRIIADTARRRRSGRTPGEHRLGAAYTCASQWYFIRFIMYMLSAIRASMLLLCMRCNNNTTANVVVNDTAERSADTAPTGILRVKLNRVGNIRKLTDFETTKTFRRVSDIEKSKTMSRGQSSPFCVLKISFL